MTQETTPNADLRARLLKEAAQHRELAAQNRTAPVAKSFIDSAELLEQAAAAIPAEAEPVACSSTWAGLADSDWVNIVNDREVIRESKEEAVCIAVRLTEAKLKELNTAHPRPSLPDDVREAFRHLARYLICANASDVTAFNTIRVFVREVTGE